MIKLILKFGIKFNYNLIKKLYYEKYDFQYIDIIRKMLKNN